MGKKKVIPHTLPALMVCSGAAPEVLYSSDLKGALGSEDRSPASGTSWAWRRGSSSISLVKSELFSANDPKQEPSLQVTVTKRTGRVIYLETFVCTCKLGLDVLQTLLQLLVARLLAESLLVCCFSVLQPTKEF